MYHYVEYVKDVNDLIRKKLDINPYIFEAEMKSLKDHDYDTYFVRDIPDILDGQIHYSTKSAVLTFDDGYEDFYTDVFPVLKKYQLKATQYVIYNYIGRKGFLNEKQIKELIESGLVEIGDHTFDHLYLKTSTAEVAKKQIIDSKLAFENRFGISIKTFAYPYGAFSKDTIDVVKEAGYTGAVSVIPGTFQSADNLFYLSRLRPGIFSGNNVTKVLEGYNK